LSACGEKRGKREVIFIGRRRALGAGEAERGLGIGDLGCGANAFAEADLLDAQVLLGRCNAAGNRGKGAPGVVGNQPGLLDLALGAGARIGRAQPRGFAARPAAATSSRRLIGETNGMRRVAPTIQSGSTGSDCLRTPLTEPKA
jgi:hypothetical protein